MFQKYFLTGCAGFIFGVLFFSFFDFGWGGAWFGLLLSVAVLFSAFILYPPADRKAFFILAIFLFTFSLGLARYELSQPSTLEFFDSKIGEIVSGVGIVSDEPDIRENHQRLFVEFEGGARAILVTKLFPEIQYGDQVQISGEITRPTSSLIEKNGREFNYAAYLAKEGIAYEFFYPKIEILAHDRGSELKNILFELKNAFLERLGQIIPEPESALAGGLLLGGKQSLGEKWLEAFRRTGVTHVIVLSGFNLTIVATWLMGLFSFLPKKWNWSIGILGIVLFTIMTGAGAATVRAAIMAVIGTIALGTGRTYTASRALLVAGLLMLFVNPRILVFDTGFQLSILATLGLIYIAPIVEPKLLWIKWKWLREPAVATVAAQIAVAPWILFVMGNFSLVALPVNLLILPLIPLTMFAAFATGLVGFFSSILSLPLAWITFAMLFYELKVVEIFNKIPFASIQHINFPFVLTILIYGGYLCFLWYYFRHANLKTS